MSLRSEYLHVEKDGIIDQIRTIAQDQGDEFLGAQYLQQLAYRSGVSASTLHSWFFGKTKRPQHITVAFVLRALDCRLAIINRSTGKEVRGRRHGRQDEKKAG